MMRTTIAVLLMLVLGAGMAAAQGSSRPTAAKETTIETPVNLNTATAAQLETLPGVGPATAQRILEYRQKSGGFKKVEDYGDLGAILCRKTGPRRIRAFRSIAHGAIWRIKDGQIVEHWHETDQLGLMHQLGVIPPPGLA